VYGEWPRRESQRVDAHAHLRTAYEKFVSIGIEAFAERARRELLATGERVRERAAEASVREVLTAQERQIALLVRDGLSNPEIGAHLLLSRSPLQKDGDPAGGFGLPDSQPVSDKVEQYYVRRISPLPADTRLLVLTAAAEPLGDTALLRHAAEKLALDRAARALAFDAGLLKLGGRARFTHSSRARPSTAPPRTRTGRRVHGDLADVTNAGADAIAAPDTSPARRRAPTWTSRLSSSAWAERARARGGLAATAAFLQRAATLSSDPARRAHPNVRRRESQPERGQVQRRE
jgi:hypothetical protein